MSEYIEGFDGTDELEMVGEALINERYPREPGNEYREKQRELYREYLLEVRCRGGKTLRDLWNFFEECEADRSKSDHLHRNIGIPTWSEIIGRRKFQRANATVQPMKIMPASGGGWESVPDIPESAMTRGLDPRTMSPIAAPAEVDHARRLEQELREEDERRNAARREADERRPEAALPDRWFGQ